MQVLDTAQLIALAGALGWASGVRLYLVVLLTGLAGFMGWVALPQGLHLLSHPVVLGVSGFMVFVEFFADKIPGLDSLWDVVHTVIRIPAGAALAAGVFGADSSVMALLAALMGGSLAATSHVAKATTRAAINTSPEPFSNVGASLLEDGMVPLSLWLAIAASFCLCRRAGAGIGAQRLADPTLLAFLDAAFRTRRPHLQRQAGHRLAARLYPEVILFKERPTCLKRS